MTKQRGAINIILLVIIVAVVGALVYVVAKRKPTSPNPPPPTPKNVQCTTEAKVCPDGKTTVGRVPPTCEFATCPEVHDQTAGWKIFINAGAKYSFTYPPTWKAAQLSTSGLFVVDLFSDSNVNPYSDERLKEGVTAVQFQYHNDTGAVNLNGWIQSYNRGSEETLGSKVANIQASTATQIYNSNGIKITRFNGIIYVIPVKPDYSVTINIASNRPDPILDRILSTFKFTK